MLAELVCGAVVVLSGAVCGVGDGGVNGSAVGGDGEKVAEKGEGATVKGAVAEQGGVVHVPMPDFKRPVDYVAWYCAEHFPADGLLGDELYAVCDKVVSPSDEVREQLNEAIKGPWSASEMEGLASYLKSMEGELAAFEAAAGVEKVRWDLSELRKSMFDLPGPSLKGVRVLGKAMVARAFMKHGDKGVDGEEFLRAWRADLGCARHVDRRFGAIPCVMAMSLRQMAYESMRKAVGLGLLNEKQRAEALRMAVEDDRPAIGEAIRSEEMFLFDFLQRAYPDGKFSIGQIRKMGQAEKFPAYGIFLPDPHVTAAVAAKYYKPIVEASFGPMSLETLKTIREVADTKESVAAGNNILAMFIPSLEHMYLFSLNVEMRRRGAVVVLGVQLYRDKHGRWPESLAELKGLVPAEFLIDPYSEGRPFVYEVKGGEPRLYSRGLNGADDGGVHMDKAYKEEKGDYVLWPGDGGEDGACLCQVMWARAGVCSPGKCMRVGCCGATFALNRDRGLLI